MVNISKSENSIKFVFTDSDHYLYGNGVVDVPVNSLLLVIDESDMVTFKKLSGDPFLSFRADNSNLGTKAAIEQFYKENMVGSTGGGSGVTPSEVQTMIDNSLEDYYTDDEVDAALSGKASISDVTAVANDVQTVSGQVATKVAITDFNAYSATTDARIAEDEEVTAAALNNLDENKQDALEYYSEDTEGNTATIHTETTDAHSYLYVNENNISLEVYSNEVTTTLEVNDNGVTINGDAVATEPYVDDAISGKVDTSAITTSITSGSTDSEIPTAKATYDAIQAGGGGVTVDPTLDTGSTNPVANSAITQAINAKADKTGCIGVVQIANQVGNYKSSLSTYNAVGSGGQTKGYFGGINGQPIAVQYSIQAKDFQLVETTAITSAITSASTNDEVAGAKAVYDAIQAGGGGGATYSAGTNISIDTANTINCTLNLANGTGNLSLKGGDGCTASGLESFASGYGTIADREGSVAFGKHNVSNSTGSNYFNGSNNSYLFTVGNGYNSGLRHNALEIRQSGNIYFADTDNTTHSNYYEKPMVRLQDMYAALGGLKLVKLTQSEYDNLPTKDNDTLYIISNVVS